MKVIECIKRLILLRNTYGNRFVMRFVFAYKNPRKRCCLLKRALENEYNNFIEDYSLIERDIYDVAEKNIWIFWWQGLDNAPDIVKACISQVKKNSGHYKIIIISKYNLGDYVKLEDYVIEKFNKGLFSITQLSDIVRYNLLWDYGGIWMDATIFMIKDISQYKIVDAFFYTQKFYMDNKVENEINYNPSEGRWATYIMASNVKNNPLFKFVVDFLNNYWRNKDELINYFLIDYITAIAYEKFGWARKIIDSVPINNVNALNILNPKNKIFHKEKTKYEFFYKLSWKENLDFLTLIKDEIDE